MTGQRGLPIEAKMFAEAVGKLCISSKLTEFTGKFNIMAETSFECNVHISWKAGRHGEESHELLLTNTIQETVKWKPSWEN